MCVVCGGGNVYGDCCVYDDWFIYVECIGYWLYGIYGVVYVGE